MKVRYLLALAALGGMAAPASALVEIDAVDGSTPYSGPTPTYDFEAGGATGGAPVTGGQVRNVSDGSGAQPFGSAPGYYWTVGPSTGTEGFLDLSSFVQIGKISFLWGSVDDYNDLFVVDRLGNDLYQFNGLTVAPPADGNQTAPSTNPLVTLTITGADQTNIGGLRLRSTTEAFETDNFAITAVPEPGTWLLMLLGFGLVGGALRASKRRETGPRVRYAF